MGSWKIRGWGEKSCNGKWYYDLTVQAVEMAEGAMSPWCFYLVEVWDHLLKMQQILHLKNGFVFIDSLLCNSLCVSKINTYISDL